MSKFYGSLQSNRPNIQTKCGDKWIQATAQSFDGSVSVKLKYDGDDLCVAIRYDDTSTPDPSQLLFFGKIEEFKENI